MARCFPASTRRRCWPGEKSGNLEQVIRRYVAYVKVVATVKRKTVSALVYPVDPDGAVARRRLDHRVAGRAGVRRVL